ncbi:PREDICTED: uncharacterized protein LOC109584826 isoform X2 [Amphimedon queenslandica]|nr:PREDICTED: uncharacterized protein LOC109584826 isoform X2 [Amphimedon queenslandica]|eukprot:XP_019856271.1 PREDICTED: uncharacterized protein LOC109584826 isoform X2 [Amphimedon queenslandica]
MGISPSRYDPVEVDELKKKIQGLRDSALKRIDKSHKTHVKGGVTCINDERLQLFLHQIENKMLLVAVVGEGSCGKSTLINAFLRDKILPSGIGKVTGFRIFIGHDSNVHKTPCPNFPKGNCNKCPYLVKGIDQRKDIFSHGVKDIASKIAENNKLDEKNQIDLVLYTYIPLFASLNTSTHFTPYLVDYPGVEDLKDYVQFRIVSAMIYVENYERLLQNEKKIKEHLHCKPEDASKFFAVSHFDKYYTSRADEENPGTEETKAIVARNIELVKCEEVFPVCGEWALRAHLALKYKERDKISCDAVKVACILCKNVQPESKLPDAIVAKASHILDVSAFEELEESLKSSIDQTNFQQWNVTVYQQCCALLEGPIQTGDNVLQIIESKMKSSRKNKRELSVKIQTLQTMEKAVQKSASEELKLDSHQNLSDFLTKRIRKKIEGRLKSFHTSCMDSVKSGNNYTFGEFMRDRNVFIEQDLSIVIMEELNKEAKKHIEAVKSRLREKYNGLVRHILGDDPNSIVFNVEAEAQEVNSCFTAEAAEGIMGFVSYRARMRRLWNVGLGVASGVSGFGVPGVLVTMGLLASSAPVLISSAAVIAGIGGSALLIRRGLNSTDQNIELSKDEVKQLCEKTKNEIKNKSETKIEHEFEKAVTSTLSEYNESLKAEYDSKWKPKLKEDFDK